MLRRLTAETFDVLIIGGGITGAGCALDAAARGLRVALVERADFASGTSSKSSKLVHGGLRYLQQGELRLVYEALAERQRLTHNAPHLVHMLPFLLPIFHEGGFINRRAARGLGLAMWAYDLTGGFRYGRLHKRITTAEALQDFPTLDAAKVDSAYVYYDAQADDARLTLAILRTAAAEGAVIANYTAFVRIRDSQQSQAGRAQTAAGGLVGVRTVIIRADGEDYELHTRTIINATGVWSDELRRTDDPGAAPRMRPAKGIHLTVPHEMVRNRVAAVIPVPGEQRTVFVVPWGKHTYVGTTDTDFSGPLDDPRCTEEDVDYLLRTLTSALTTRFERSHVLGTWAGLRPLIATGGAARSKTSDLSRHHVVEVSPSGFITVAGGKLTTYRKMAADTVDEVMNQLGRHGRSLTEDLQLVGADGVDRGAALPHLVGRYGSEAAAVEALAVTDPTLRAAARRGPALPPRGGALRDPPRDGVHRRRRTEPPHTGPRTARRGQRESRARCRHHARSRTRPQLR